jgi:hypothetical protein
MKFIVLLAAVSCAKAQVVTVAPAVITHCDSYGHGIGLVIWNYDGPGPVVVHVDSSSGPPFTGPSDPSGSQWTGQWVVDEQVFVLTDISGRELGRVAARVKCNPEGEVLLPGLASATYFPLQVGDQWIYNYSSRVVTSEYRMLRVSRAEIIGNDVWFVIEESTSGSSAVTESRYRNDAMGRVFQLTAQGPQLWLDPTWDPNPSAILKISGHGIGAQTPAGTFSNTISYAALLNGLFLETGALARGIGRVYSSSNVLAGSSGGFSDSYTLVYAKIDDHIVYSAPAVAIQLSVEATSFDVSNRKAPNCAVPCYFVACGLVPGADPPGTYKPCFGARVQLGRIGWEEQSVDLELLDDTGRSVYRTTASAPQDQMSTVERPIPLYSSPNTPFSTGAYQLRARTPDGRTATTPIHIE